MCNVSLVSLTVRFITGTALSTVIKNIHQYNIGQYSTVLIIQLYLFNYMNFINCEDVLAR
jgi:hypothetical protein